jgi:hypothetical protein
LVFYIYRVKISEGAAYWVAPFLFGIQNGVWGTKQQIPPYAVAFAPTPVGMTKGAA